MTEDENCDPPPADPRMGEVLVVDDDPDVCRTLAKLLTHEGFRVRACCDPMTALLAAIDSPPDLVLLDVEMPGMDGIEFCKRLRTTLAAQTIPVVMLSGHTTDEEVLAALEAGADLYIRKPWNARTLAPQLAALMRLADTPAAHAVLRHGPLTVDLKRHEVLVGGKVIALLPCELRILRLLLTHRDRVLTRMELLGLNETEAAQGVRNVDVYIAMIRRKLGQHGDLIETVRGMGYRIAREDRAASS